ncbi:MAG: gamma-glutamyltransferase [Chloroflexota bacterium]|nr:gamma-glutamyltransferase [Chloroflexota bacterium]MDE2885013.1 gamma-glutamyltransferase [Chloroflexota bacterium]
MTWKKNAGSPFQTYKHDAVATNGMVATNHPLASAAGLEMLAMGGNAMDAAVASAFALSVVEPMMVGIFGAGFINFYNASDDGFAHIDNYSVAPHAAAPDMYETVSDTWPDYMETVDRANNVGYRSVGVPGALKGWCYAEERYGRLGLDTVIQPAIRYARRGFPASRYLVDIIHQGRQDLAMFPASADVFLPGGSPPPVGDLIVREDYGNTLGAVARDGPDALYTGSIGERVVDDMAANGGIVSSDDLRDYRIHQREPVTGTYRGYEIVSVGPASSGGTAIVEILNILEGFDVAGAGFGTAAGVHLLAESMKIAFADRFEYLGDPGFVDVPVAALTAKEYAASRRGEIDPGSARSHGYGNPSAYAGEGANTTHLTVADADGNVVSTTQTLNAAFGSRVTTPGTGMLLNNTMNIFDPHPGSSNSIAPGKRMVSSMAPTIVMKDGRPFMALGTPGATRIFPSVLQAIVNVIDHGMTLQEAVEAPRVWTQGQSLEVERGIAPRMRERLQAMGHDVEEVAKVAGGMNGVMFDHRRGVMRGAACWRADGTPAGFSGGPARPASGEALYRF